MANNAKLTDVETLVQAGIDPKTGLPIKVADTLNDDLKNNIKKLLRIVDEQDAVNRYRWYNLPSGLTGQMIERILYYKGQGMFFYMPENETFYFLPYALDGTIDVYGRYTGVTPLPFTGGATKTEDGKEKPWIQGLTRKPVYDINLEEMSEKGFIDKCVLLSDYSKQISQTILPRQSLQEPLLDAMSDCIPFMRTALQNETGVVGMRVESQDEESNVKAANASIRQAARTGQRYVAVIGNVDFQDLTFGAPGQSIDFMQAMESLDNFRLGLYGIDNGGLFQKKAHMLQTEQNMAGGSTGLVYQDGLTLRQAFCDIVNSYTNLGISCEPSETEIGDSNMDGIMADEQDQQGYPGEQNNMAMATTEATE